MRTKTHSDNYPKAEYGYLKREISERNGTLKR